MAVKLFSKEMVEQLNSNQYVMSATTKRITYTESFKEFFINMYAQGHTPREIFLTAGFDVEALGNKRIERASARWREANNVENHRRKIIPKDSLEKMVVEQEREIQRLNAELREIKEQVQTLKA